MAFREAPDLHTAAHEAAHVVQQRGGVQLAGGVGNAGDAHERHADAVAERTVQGLPAVDLLEQYQPGTGSHAAVQRQQAAAGSRPSDEVRAAANPSAVFAVLRRVCPVRGDSWSAGTLANDGDPDLTRELAAKLGNMPDDVWLATQIRQFGSEPLWPAAAIEERARRANAPGSFGGRAWAPEAGNFGAQVDIPDRERGEDRIAPISVYFFPGRSGRRAMVVGGVHGTEHQGVEVVNQLRTQLEADSLAGNPPFFSTVLVPTLIQRSDTAGRRNVCGPNSSGVPDAANVGVGQPCADGSRAVEPNRTFPGLANPGNRSGEWSGQSYQDARREGLRYQAQPNGPPSTPPAQRMIAETRALIALIEHFQPERLASIHAHSVPGRRGDGPGIFVDPRGGVTRPADPTQSEAATPQGREDDRLTQEMLTRAESDVSGAARPDGSTNPFAANPLARSVAPLRGNQAGTGGDTVHYSASHPSGTSLGDWAPSRGITTVTVEVPQGVAGDDLRNIETMHRDLLQRVFLADPALVTPGAFGTAPAGLQGRSDAPPPKRAP